MAFPKKIPRPFQAAYSQAYAQSDRNVFTQNAPLQLLYTGDCDLKKTGVGGFESILQLLNSWRGHGADALDRYGAELGVLSVTRTLKNGALRGGK